MPAAAPVAVGVIGLLVLLALIDAVASQRALDGVEVELPDAVRLSLDRAGDLDARVRNERGGALRLRLGIAFPAELAAASDDLATELPGGEGPFRVRWSVTPRRRGSYRLHDCRLETPSPIGFWGVRRVLPAATEVRVYPDLLRDRKQVASLFLRQGAFGAQAQRQIGKGREFEQLRAYQPGDSYGDIHWKATAKRRRPVTKVFQIERTQEVYVAIDASRLSARVAPGDSLPALERSLNAALLLALAAERQGDLFGLLAFAAGVNRFVRAGGGKQHFHACREALVTLTSETASPDFGEIASFIRTRLRRRALLVFLTDLEDPLLAEGFVRGLELIGRQHLVEVVMVRPPQAAPLFAAADVETTDQIYDRLAGHVTWTKLLELAKTLRHRGAHLSLVDSERLTAETVSRYVAIKRRQIL